MSVDQAAGLRRRRDASPLPAVYCFFESAAATLQLTQSLRQLGRTVLLVDTCGRLFADTSTRSLFHWQQQLARGQLLTQPTASGDGWFAPGLMAEIPVWERVALDYDHVVVDAGPPDTDLVIMPMAIRSALVTLDATVESKLRAFSLIKTLATDHQHFSVGLLGKADACDHVREACCRFLAPDLGQGIYIVAQEGDAFAALAVRMLAEEASLTTRYKTGQTLKHAW